jgi:hypothetical protein
MAGYWDHPDARPDDRHHETISMRGRTIREMREVVAELLPRGGNKSFNFLCVMGGNDLRQGRSPADIVADIAALRHTCTDTHDASTFVISTVVMSPDFNWYPADGAKSPEYVNRIGETVELNNAIINQQAHGAEHFAAHPRFHQMGITSKRGVMRDRYGRQVVDRDGQQETTQYKYHIVSAWRGTDQLEKRVHLSVPNVRYMCRAVCKHFATAQQFKLNPQIRNEDGNFQFV